MARSIDGRRRRPRFPRQLPVRFGTEARMCNGTVLNISEGGLQIQSPDPFPVNSIVSVFVRFPRETFRLRARVAWIGGPPPGMGLSFVDPVPALAETYRAWVHEVRDSRGFAAAQAAPETDRPPSGPPPDGTPVADRSGEPQAPVRRRMQTLRGEAYDVLFERRSDGWHLTVFELPRQLGVRDPDFQGVFPDYASADQALRDFLRTRS